MPITTLGPSGDPGRSVLTSYYRMDTDARSLNWQHEFPRAVGQVFLVLMSAEWDSVG